MKTYDQKIYNNSIHLNTFEDKINQIIYNYKINKESLDKIASTIYKINKKDIYDAFAIVEKSIKSYLYQIGGSPIQIEEKTKEIIEYIKEYLSMIIAQNVITKVNGKNFLDNFIQKKSKTSKY